MYIHSYSKVVVNGRERMERCFYLFIVLSTDIDTANPTLRRNTQLTSPISSTLPEISETEEQRNLTLPTRYIASNPIADMVGPQPKSQPLHHLHDRYALGTYIQSKPMSSIFSSVSPVLKQPVLTLTVFNSRVPGIIPACAPSRVSCRLERAVQKPTDPHTRASLQALITRR